MDFDLRTRTMDHVVPVDAHTFVTETVPALLAAADGRADLAARALAGTSMDAFTLAVDGVPHTWRLTPDGTLEVVPGDTGDGPRADLTAAWFTDLVHDVRSTVAVMIADEPVMSRGRIGHLISWEPTLRALLDGRPSWEPGLVDFVDRHGAPLDLARTFTLDDDPAEVAHFLGQAGFLHLRNVCSAAEMADLSAEIDRWRDRMTPDDPRAWYAAVADRPGAPVCVRVTDIDVGELDFPHDARLAPIAALVGAGHRYVGTDLLVKPVGVVEGVSDLPWHRDCELGGHSYRCTSLTCGMAVTPSGPDNGQLGVVAGSHRVNVTMFDLDRIDLPKVFLTTETGDVTVHVSCALHSATPPVHHERRVTYSSLRLPGDTHALDATTRAVRNQAGRETYAPA